MTAIDVHALLEPFGDETPSGPSVEYDPRYIELERLARGVSQEENAEGKVIREAEPPDWPEVERIAIELCAESKDLRVAIYLARARIALEGLSGFRDAVELLNGYVSNYWPSVHPQLDAADDNDPSIRVNTLIGLCDTNTVLRALRMAPLTQSRQFGRISYRDYSIATGLMQAPAVAMGDEKLPDISRIEAAFADTAIEVLDATREAATKALESLAAIDASLNESLGAANGPDFTPLQKLMGEIKKLLDRELAKRGGGDMEEPPGEADMASESGDVQPTAGRGAAGGGAVRSRDDVLVLIDRICRYYSEYEPSSPIPIILNRTKRLVTMSFLDILKDLTPGGVQEFGVIAGIKEEE